MPNTLQVTAEDLSIFFEGSLVLPASFWPEIPRLTAHKRLELGLNRPLWLHFGPCQVGPSLEALYTFKF